MSSLIRQFRGISRASFIKKFALLLLVCFAAAARAQGVPTSNPYDQTRTSSFTYAPAASGAKYGLLQSETIEPGKAQLGVTTTYDYDAYGNKKLARTSSLSGASATVAVITRTSSSAYAASAASAGATGVTLPAGAYATVSTNALNQSENKTYDPRFGTPLVLTGPNGLQTKWTVDDFGRTVKELRADGSSTLSYYCYIGNTAANGPSTPSCPAPASGEAPADAYFYTHTEPHDANGVRGAASRTYTDRAGRKIRTVTEAFDGTTQAGGASRLIVQDITYNAYGLQILTTQPHFLDTGASTATGSSAAGFSLTAYDVLGRPIVIQTGDPNGSAFGQYGAYAGHAAVTKIAYNGLSTTTTNDLNQTRKEDKNVEGAVILTTDNLGATIAFQYDAFGNLVTTKDALGNQTSVAYDDRGRKVAMTDPDTGNWTYNYDVLGELVWQQSPNQRAASQTTTMAYDLLGRMTSRTESELYSTWSYDTCTKGIGKLCASSSAPAAGQTDLSRQYAYDATGRPLSTYTQIAGGPTMASAVAYGTDGRLASQTYPTGLTVNYNYTAKGFLSTLTLATQATVNPLPATVGGTPGATVTLPTGTVLWSAISYNAWGNAEQQSVGNGVATTSGFDPTTGRVAAVTAGTSSNATAVLNQGYTWDSLGHLSNRKDAIGDGTSGALGEAFTYDGIGRLTNYTVTDPAIASGSRAVTLQYNALGLLLYKSDVGDYVYPTQGNGVVGPHALTQSINASATTTYHYDANGNLTSADGGTYRRISYTSFNQPDGQAGISGAGFAGSAAYSWKYDENHARVKEVRAVGGVTTTTWNLHPDNQGGLGFESESSTSNPTPSNRHYLTVGGQTIGVLVSVGSLPNLNGQTTPTPLASMPIVKVEYWHKDHLGSLAATTDHTGAVTQRYAYDPFGKRRQSNGNYDAANSLIADWTPNTNHGTPRGFTGHEGLDDVGLVHMNGRIFDPTLGRFLQGDPMVQDPMNLQNYNRYGYCFNNPMGCTDPSGMSFWTSFLRPVLKLAAAVTAAYFAAPLLTQYLAAAELVAGVSAETVTALVPYEIAATGGFAAGIVNTGTLKGGVQGAFTAEAFYAVGTAAPGYGQEGADSSSIAWNTAGHAAVGCVSASISGGNCGRGAVAAALPAAYGNYEHFSTNAVYATMESSALGGVGSVVTGGKFANGMVTGAFGYIFNDYIHRDGHEYSYQSTICSIMEDGCTRPTVFDALLHHDYPFQPSDTAVENNHTYEIPSVGPIKVTIDADNFTVTNTTAGPDHIFCCGYVQQSVVVVDSMIAINVYGTGNNSNFGMAFLNYLGGDYFRYSHAKIIQYVAPPPAVGP